MKKILYSVLIAGTAISLVSCNDFLETSSTSVVDADFVFSNTTTARAAMEGGYEQWRSTANSYVFGAGLFYAADIAGSDIERHPEAYTAQVPRHIPECLYENGTKTSTYDIDSYSSNSNTGAYVQLYNAIGKANAVIAGIKNSETGKAAIKSGERSGLGQLYGEAVALRATCYRELIKYYGDVPLATVFGETTGGLCPRDSIYDFILKDLQDVEPLMYPVGSIPDVPSTNKNYFSQTYVDCLIGRIALEAAGYQTRRSDITYPYQMETLGRANANADNAFYARRADYKQLYEVAKKYFGKILNEGTAGTAQLVTVDPRATDSGREFGNPYQYFFQQMMMDDAIYATESIYEYPMQQNVSSDERSYSSGRPATGGSNTYPTKCYGQCRINPAFYYGMYDPKDMRRDVTCTVTGTNSGVEVLLPLTNGSQAKAGGIALNKWDDCRMTKPNVTAQRKSGINGPYMRISEVYLGYAEACSMTGDDNIAKEYLRIIRQRAFKETIDLDAYIAECGARYPKSSLSDLTKAIIEERGLEYAGEGDRRFTLIRTGLFPEAIKNIKKLTRAMIDGLKNNGSYTFANGNVISSQIYTKTVDAKALKGYRLTAQHLTDDDPILYPAWRGVADDWSNALGYDAAKVPTTNVTNLAIEGLFKPVKDADALLADGYVAQDWGKTIVSLEDQYYKYLFTDYDYESAPIYLWPICPNSVAAGGFSNGYGFSNE